MHSVPDEAGRPKQLSYSIIMFAITEPSGDHQRPHYNVSHVIHTECSGLVGTKIPSMLRKKSESDLIAFQ